MKQVSSKRAKALRVYNKIKAELEIELKEKGEWKCFFSGIPIPDYFNWKDVPFHHLKSRDGDLLTDKKFIVPVNNQYHTGDEGYHNKPFSHLQTLWWWDGFMKRLKKVDYDLWYNHKLRESK